MTPPPHLVPWRGTPAIRPSAATLGVFAALAFLAAAALAGAPAFEPAADQGFTFDTGILRGRLRAGGRSLGLQEVVHSPTGQRLDRSNGLLSHYRVFANGRRYGAGAWDWPSTARRRDDGAVEVVWNDDPDRPFQFRAVYRWKDPSTLDLETSVRAVADLHGFESFVASYFHESFSNAVAYVAGDGPPRGVRARRDAGDWQMFARDEAALALIRDGRWKLEPNPVEWTIRPGPALALVRRRVPLSGLSALLLAPRDECFAVSMPHETEGHYSVYLSLVGRDLKAGESVLARTRLCVATAIPDAAVLAQYEAATREWTAR